MRSALSPGLRCNICVGLHAHVQRLFLRLAPSCGMDSQRRSWIPSRQTDLHRQCHHHGRMCHSEWHEDFEVPAGSLSTLRPCNQDWDPWRHCRPYHPFRASVATQLAAHVISPLPDLVEGRKSWWFVRGQWMELHCLSAFFYPATNPCLRRMCRRNSESCSFSDCTVCSFGFWVQNPLDAGHALP